MTRLLLALSLAACVYLLARGNHYKRMWLLVCKSKRPPRQEPQPLPVLLREWVVVE